MQYLKVCAPLSIVNIFDTLLEVQVRKLGYNQPREMKRIIRRTKRKGRFHNIEGWQRLLDPFSRKPHPRATS